MDGIVWTLEIEVRFYCLCFLIASSLRRSDVRGVMITLLMVALSTAAIDHVLQQRLGTGGGGVSMLAVFGLDGQMLVYMLIGTLFYLRLRGVLTCRALLGFLTATAAVFAFLWSVGPESAQRTAGVASYGAALLVFATCFALRAHVRGGGILARLADISYPLYVAHAIPGYVVMRLALAAGLAPWACIVLALCWAVGSAVVIHRYVESGSHAMGRRWARRLS
jgi:peptidoglycan/LPS O-acetylase OafA/YrhL